MYVVVKPVVQNCKIALFVVYLSPQKRGSISPRNFSFLRMNYYCKDFFILIFRKIAFEEMNVMYI